MSESYNSPLDNMSAEQKASKVMVYTRNYLAWGSVITHQNIHAARLLIGVTIPDFVNLMDGQIIYADQGFSKPIKRHEIYVPTESVIAYHLMPPMQEEIMVEEIANQKDEPFSVFLNGFQIKATIRLASQSSIRTILSVSKATFMEVFNVEVSMPFNPKMKPITTNYALIRREAVIFSSPE